MFNSYPEHQASNIPYIFEHQDLNVEYIMIINND
jgi:hypothetical protein